MYYFDVTYYIYIIPGLVLAIIAQIWITSAYNKFSKLSPGRNSTGLDAANTILEGESYPVSIDINGEALSDYFNPINNVVSISRPSSENSSVADIAIVAHEFGHVDQKFSGSFFFNLRKILVPIVNIGSNLGYILFILGFVLNLLNLSQIGLILFSGTTVFALITIPVEINASQRGLAFVRKYNLIEESRIPEAKQVLMAAALTYVASLITSLLQLMYFVNIFNRRK